MTDPGGFPGHVQGAISDLDVHMMVIEGGLLDLAERLDPIEPLGLLAPETIGIDHRLLVHGLVGGFIPVKVLAATSGRTGYRVALMTWNLETLLFFCMSTVVVASIGAGPIRPWSCRGKYSRLAAQKKPPCPPSSPLIATLRQHGGYAAKEQTASGRQPSAANWPSALSSPSCCNGWPRLCPSACTKST